MEKEAMKSKETIAILAIVLVMSSVVGEAAANPITPPMVKIASPQNNQVYSQSNVWLNFSAVPMAINDFNFSSFSYSLDGQASQITNGGTLLTNLPSGSHSLVISGKATEGYWKDKDMLLDIVYFSINYSTPWVVFTVVLLTTSVPLLVGLFVNRRAVVQRLRRKKTASFWVGLACFLFFTVFVFGPSIWQLTNKYLFPRYGYGTLEISIVPMVVIFGLIFMVIGFLLMAIGTRQDKFR
jgi:hypothetical protein